MIDPGVFRSEWALLCERFRMTGEREPSQLMLRRYYEWLTERMDTDEFVAAAARLYATAEFFPKPADFLPKANAAAQWEEVLPLLANVASTADRLDPEAKRAVRIMGGLSAIGAVAGALHYRRGEFMALYCELHAGAVEQQASAVITRAGSMLINSAMGGAGAGELKQLSEGERGPAP